MQRCLTDLSVIKDLDYARDLKPWLPADWEVEHVFVHRRNVVAQIREAKADVYVNLCGRPPIVLLLRKNRGS
jgi:hypothetical protein